MKRPILLVNFGGPRSLSEIEPFLISLLTDRDVIRTKLPYFLQKLLFTRVAKKRAKKIEKDYLLIGGRSPIYEDTEHIAREVSLRAGVHVTAFHRYLNATHAQFIGSVSGPATVFPLFPQFTYATTGSIARFFAEHLDPKVAETLHWVKSYATHPAYVTVMQRCISEFMKEKKIEENETILLFSAHGLPQEFVDQGDVYQRECTDSFQAISAGFPHALARLSYQSKFGRGEWLRPYTDEICRDICAYSADRKQVVMIPLSFTSDHIETLFEIEKL
ncbi:MAG: ferrochelatase, partial [Chlamydiales bacterium]